ncbi:MAG TPA: damage-inducible protein [Stellaceae bacterium]|nr:damage-inducible protein [Stellaceae bacterium]
MPRSAVNLDALRDRLRHLEQPARHGVLPFGVAAIDAALPAGGLLLGAMHEILSAGGDEEDGAAAAGFAAGILARLVPEGGPGPVLWCLKRPDVYGPGLAAHGLVPARLVLVAARRDEEILWAVEEGLGEPGLAAVVGEVGRLPMVAGRRLQLAAERSGVTLLLLRRWRSATEAAAERARPSAAATRWRVAALPSADTAGEPGVGRPRWRVELVRCRGGVPAEWDVEVADATGHVSLSAGLVDRPPAASRKIGRSAAAPGRRRTG